MSDDDRNAQADYLYVALAKLTVLEFLLASDDGMIRRADFLAVAHPKFFSDAGKADDAAFEAVNDFKRTVFIHVLTLVAFADLARIGLVSAEGAGGPWRLLDRERATCTRDRIGRESERLTVPEE